MKLRREAIAGVDFDGHVIADGGVDDLLHALGRPEGVVVVGDNGRQEGGVGVNVDGLGVHDGYDAVDEGVHEDLRVVPFDFFRDPESHAVALLIRPGHGVGEDVVEFGDDLRGEEGDPFAAFGLHGLINGLTFEGLVVSQQRQVVSDGETQAAVAGDAEFGAVGFGDGDGFVKGEAAFEVDVIVDKLKVGFLRRGGVGGLLAVGVRTAGGEHERNNEQSTDFLHLFAS